MFVTQRKEIAIKLVDSLRSNAASLNHIAQFLMRMDQFNVPHPCVDNSVATLMTMDSNLTTTKIPEEICIPDYERELKEDNYHWRWYSIEDNHVLSFMLEIHKYILELEERFAKFLILE